MAIAVFIQAFNYLDAYSWIHKIVSTDLDSRRTCQHKLYRILPIRNTSQPNDRDLQLDPIEYQLMYHIIF